MKLLTWVTISEKVSPTLAIENDPEEEVKDVEENSEVIEHYHRVIASEAFFKAKLIADKCQYKKA
jgi:hypothetical protein